MDTLIGKTISHYRILEQIGAGGMEPGQAFLLPPYTPDHGHPETSLCFTRDGAWVAATAGSASVYDLTTHRRIARYAPEPVKDRSITNWAFSPDGRSAAAATSKGVYLWSFGPAYSARTKI